jgi:uncharacterized membrane protein YqiK
MFISKKLVISWERSSCKNQDIVWGVPNERFPKLENVKEVIVKEHERAVLFASGVITKILTPGNHQISKGITDIVWVDVSPKTCPFGICKDSNLLLTNDGKRIGISGFINLKVREDEGSIRLFFKRVVAGQKTFNCDQLVEWLLKGLLSSVFHDIIGKFSSAEISKTNMARFGDLVLAGISEELSNYGLEASSIHIVGIVGL